MNRKKFIESCGVIGAGAVMSPSLVKSGILSRAGTGKIKVAVIGCGSLSGVYLPHITKSQYIDVVSVCDIKPARAKARAEQFMHLIGYDWMPFGVDMATLDSHRA